VPMYQTMAFYASLMSLFPEFLKFKT